MVAQVDSIAVSQWAEPPHHEDRGPKRVRRDEVVAGRRLLTSNGDCLSAGVAARGGGFRPRGEENAKKVAVRESVGHGRL